MDFILCCDVYYTESVVDQTDHFADVFVRESVAYGYGVVATLMRSKAYSRRHFVSKSSVRQRIF